MGLNVYAGTLTRYYANNWKCAVQQWAEAHGYTFRKIDTNGEQVTDEGIDPVGVQQALEVWRDEVLEALASPEEPPLAPWPENNEAPYYTDKPDWDAFGAMLLVAACHLCDEPVPPTVEKDWDYPQHPLIDRLARNENQQWSLFRGVGLWLPLPDSFLVRGPLPTGDVAMIGTVAGLRAELEQLNEMAWQASEETILGWSETEGYPADGTLGPDGKLLEQEMEEHTRYDTQSLAKFSFSVFWQAARFAEEKMTPVLLDF